MGGEGGPHVGDRFNEELAVSVGDVEADHGDLRVSGRGEAGDAGEARGWEGEGRGEAKRTYGYGLLCVRLYGNFFLVTSGQAPRMAAVFSMSDADELEWGGEGGRGQGAGEAGA